MFRLSITQTKPQLSPPTGGTVCVVCHTDIKKQMSHVSLPTRPTKTTKCVSNWTWLSIKRVWLPFPPPTRTSFGSVTKESCDFLEIGRIARNQTKSPEIGPNRPKTGILPTNLMASQPVQMNLFWTRKVLKLEQTKKIRQIWWYIKLKSLNRKAPNGRRMGRKNNRFFGPPIVPGKDF